MKAVVQSAGTHRALVFPCDASLSLVGDLIPCRIKGPRLDVEMHTQNLLVAGDLVDIGMISEKEGIIEARAPRCQSLFRFNKKRRLRQCMASHVEKIVLLSTENEPPCSFTFLQNSIAAAVLEEISVLLVIHKCDLPLSKGFQEKMNYLASLGAPLLYSSCVRAGGLDELEEALASTRVALIGRSGVGKSSILNRFAGRRVQTTQKLMQQGRRGRNTTTQALLYPMKSGAWIIDTPGVLTMDLSDRRKEVLARAFNDFNEYHCWYRNCMHYSEPGCAVRKALEEGLLPSFRYHYYTQYLHSMSTL